MAVNLERGKIWVPPGTYEGEHLADPRSKFPRYPFPLGSATSLASLSKDFAFFSLGIPIKVHTFNDAYLHDLASVLDNKFKLYVLSTKRAFFRHLNIGNDVTFNHTMFAVRRTYWKMTSDFLVSIGLLDRISGQYHKYAEQEFLIPDPLTGGPDVIKLTVTAVNSTVGQFVARRDVDGMLRAVRLKADPRFVTFGAAVIAGHPNPMSLIEDGESYNIPTTPFQHPTTKKMDELSSSDRSRVIKSIEEIKNARARGEFPQVNF